MPRTVICLGAGPSLLPSDAALCARHFVIAVNESYRVAPFADVLYAADFKWWQANKGVPSFRGMKYALPPFASPIPGVTVLERGETFGLSRDPHRLALNGNSGAQAINLAVHYEAERIILLGYDMQPAADGSHHWHEPHLGDLHPNYRRGIDALAGMKEALTAAGVSVFNASRTSAIPDFIFPRVSLPEVLDVESLDHHPSWADPRRVYRTGDTFVSRPDAYRSGSPRHQ